MLGFRARLVPALGGGLAVPFAWPRSGLVVAAFLAGIGAGPALAADRYWDVNQTAAGSGGTGVWNLGNFFWSNNSSDTLGPYNQPWSNGDNAIFSGTAGAVTLGAPITANGLTFNTSGYTIAGTGANILTLGGAAPTITANGNATISAVIAGTAGLTKEGAGILTLTGANSFTGGIVVDEGELSVTSDAALGNASNTVTLNGTTLTATGALSGSREVVINGDVRISGGGVGSALFTGTGTLSIFRSVTMNNDANSYAGTTITNGFGTAGTVRFTSVRNTGVASSLGASGDVIFRGTNVYTGVGDTTNRTFRIQPSSNTSAGLINSGTGALALTGTISLEGGPRGIFFNADTADLALSGPISGTISGNAVLTYDGGGTARTITLAGANTYTNANSIGTVTLAVSTLTDRGTASSLGTNDDTGAGLADIQINGGVLSYTGIGNSSNRTWKISNSSSVLNNGTGALALTGAVTFDAVASIDTLTLGGSFATSENTISGDITGTGRIVKNGASTWVLSGNNSYTGTTTVESGTLRAGSATAFNQLSSVTVNGGTFDLGGYDYTFTRLDGTGGAVELGAGDLTVNVATGGTPNYAGTIQGSGGFTKRGGGTQTLTGANTYTGDTNLAGGTLALDFSPAGGPTSDIVSSDSTLNMAGGTVQITGAVGQANGQTFDGLNITAGSNRIIATAGASGGTMVVNFGGVTRTGGQIDFGIGSGVTMSVAPGTTLGGWATVNGSDYADVDASNNIVAFTNYDLGDDAATWGDGDIVTDTGGAANTPFFGTVSDSGGDNIVQLGGLRYTVARNSTVNVGPGQTLGLDGTVIVASSVGGTSQTISGGSVRGAAGGVLGVQQNSTGTFTISSTIVDNGGATGLTVGGIGAGSVVLGNAANTYTGATWITRGKLSVATLANGSVASSIGASSADSFNLVLEGGTLSYTGGSVTTDRGFTVMRSGAVTGGTIEVTQSSTNLSFGGEVVSPDGGGLTKTGSGTLTLANANSSYTGATVVTGGGTLSVATLANGSANSSIGASSNASANLFIEGGSTFQYTGTSVTSDRGFTLNGTAGGMIDVSSAGTELTLAGTAAGLGSAPLTKVGAGTLTLSGINTYNGETRVNAGTLRAGSTQAFGLVNLVVMANTAGATLDLDGYDNRVAGLSGGGANGGDVLLGDAMLTIGGTNASYSGAISGTGGLIKDNTNVQAMVGCNNSYTGSTTIRAGILSVDCIRDGGEVSGIGASDADADSLVLSTNGTLQYTGATVTTDRGFHLASGWGGINVAEATTTLEFTGNVTNAAGGGLVKDGAGTLKLSGTNSYGATLAREGTLIAGSTQAFGAGALAIYGGATVDLANNSNSVGALEDLNDTSSGTLLLGSADLTITTGGTWFFGTIQGTGGLIKNGGDFQGLGGCGNSYSGGTTINAGWIYADCMRDGGVNSSVGSSSADASNLVIGGTSAAGLHYSGSENTSTNRRFTMGNTATLRSSGTGTINFTSTDAISHTGTGTRQLRLGGTNTGTNILAAQIVDNGASAVALVKEDAGTWRVSNQVSTFTGATTITGNGGVLEVTKLANGGENSSIGRSTAIAGNLVIGTNGTLRYVGSGDSTNRLFTLGTGTTIIASSGTGALNFTDSGGLMGFTGTGARTFTLGGTYAGNNIMGVTIRDQSGTAQTSLAKNDSGTWILTANNTYTGNTVINDGKLIIGNGGTTGNVGTGEVILAFSTGTLGFNRSDTFTFAGKISGPGTIEQMGEGTTILTAVNSAGGTKISEGTLQVNGDLTTNTITFEDDETTTLIVNGSVHGAAGAPALITGDASANIITINSGGALTANGDLGGGMDVVTISGTLATGGAQLSLGAGNDTLVLNDTAVFSGAGVDGGAGTGDVLRVSNGSARSLAGSQVGGFESLVKTLGGTLTLTGSHGFSAGTSVDTGSLIVDGSLGSGPVTVAGGATLGGNGTAGGSVTIANGGALAPGSAGNVPGTLTVGGNLTLNSGSTLAYDFGQANTIGGALNDHTIVGGNLRLDGTLNMTVSPGGAFAPGFYRVFTYGGALDNQGLALGPSVPSGVTVDTATAGQVNLLSTGDLTLNFWDGGTPGNHFDDVAQGGNGIWQSTGGNVNWTDEPGNGTSANASWTDAAFAIFQGSAGTVMVDNAPAAVTTAGMQFRTTGYVIDGAPLSLVPLGSGNAVIRVGEGAATDASITATISAQLTGSTGLTKTDGGRLILTAVNTYTGQTVIAGGVIQVAAENALGANGTLVLEGGTLNTTTSFALGKNVTLNGPGGAMDVDGGTTLTASGTISGAGALTKAGSGTLVLTGTNDYSGGTNFSGGVVSITAAANLGTGPLTFNGGTLRTDGVFTLAMGGTINAPGGMIDTVLGDLTISGDLTGTGPLTKTGAGTLTLTGTNTYAGGTTIATGTLQLGNGGTEGSITGNITNNAQLFFNRSDEYTFDGVISGTGAVVQVGSGITILTGANTYGGITDVAEGTLLVNGDQTGATGLTRVRMGATLGGTGIIGGDVTVDQGGTLAPGNVGAPGTLAVNGSLTLQSGSTLAYNFGQPDVVGGSNNDHTVVAGDLDMQGAEIDVSVTAGGTFGPGVYRVVTYGGDLLSAGLSLGDVPADSDLLVDTATLGQVNLVNRFGAMLTYWDGGAPANKDNGIVDGGDGVWQNQDLASNINWTDNAGALNGRWTDDAFAIFQGSAGTVQVDNSNGAVTASGMQFLVDGYEIAGQPLTLVPWSSGTNAIIRVGSGAPDDASLITTISAELTGGAGLTKTDGGRLVLTAANSYTGTTVIEGGVIEVAAESALGSSSLVLQGGTLNTTTSFALGKDITLELPGGGLDVNGGTTLELIGMLAGSGELRKTGTGTLLQSITGADTHSGPTTVAQGTLLAGNADVLSTASAYSVLSGATLDLDGFDQTVASLDNAGDVRLDGAPGTTLTLINDYVGSGGTIYINTQLGNDASPTDRLVVGGSTSGSSILNVTNVGGTGGPTVEGIKVVDVAGASNGTFTLYGDYVFEGDQAVVGGAYAYRLYKNGVADPLDGDWYLRSSLVDPVDPDPEEPEPPLYQPGVPLYEAYANVLQSFQKLETLQQRVGNRSWQPGTGVLDLGNAIEDGALWGRIVADQKIITPDMSTAGITYDVNNWRIEAGFDSTLSVSEGGKLVGGLDASFGTSSAGVNSVYGDGSISSMGFGLGATLTYYGSGGFYLDGQARVTGFDSTLHSATADLDVVEGNKGFGYALSLEAGQKVVVTDQFSLTPQAQLAYSSVQFDDFTDAFGADVSLKDGDSLVARVGVSADFEQEWQNEAGESGRTHVYGIANLYYELLEGSDVDVAGSSFVNKADPFWGGVGIGGSINWADDKYSIYGEVLANTSLGAIGENYSLGATGGMRVKW